MMPEAARWRRWRRRAELVIKNSAYGLLTPLLSSVVSAVVVRVASAELWGQLVNPLILVTFSAHILAWGNKEYLLRGFAQQPGRLAEQWQTSLLTRLALWPLFVLVVLAQGTPPGRAAWLAVWCLALLLAQSYDVLVLYRRDFTAALLIEAGGLVVVLALILAGRTMPGLDRLIILLALGQAAKAAAYAGRFGSSVAGRWRGRFDRRYYWLALPFFLLGFSGMLNSRIDLYAVTYFRPPAEIARYQVLINLVLYLQALSAFVLQPFLKGLYRLRYSAILKIGGQMALLGALILPPGVLAMALLVRLVYGFAFSADYFLYALLMLLPTYAFIPIIYALYKANRQTLVLGGNILGSLLNLGFNLALLPRVGLVGALMASALTKWLLLLYYLALSRRLPRTLADAPLGSSATLAAEWEGP